LPWPLGVSSSVLAGGDVLAHMDALDASTVDRLELVMHGTRCPLGDAAFRSALIARLRQARVRLHSVHLPFGRALDLSLTDEPAGKEALEATVANLRLAASIGAPLAVVHPSSEPIADDGRAARFAASQRRLQQLSQVAAAEGVRLAVECLPRTCLAHTAVECNALIAALDPAVVGVCVDTNHLNLREPDIGGAVLQLSPRLLTLHCSDNDGVDERHWLPRAPGGVVDWPALLTSLRSASYSGPFLYEVRPPDQDAAAALRAIQANYATLGQAAGAVC
jgi:sugar phosphate isomerase/epimerase